MNEQGNNTNTAPFARKISNTAKELAQRMHTIIWSLNAENDTVENFLSAPAGPGVADFRRVTRHTRRTDWRD